MMYNLKIWSWKLHDRLPWNWFVQRNCEGIFLLRYSFFLEECLSLLLKPPPSNFLFSLALHRFLFLANWGYACFMPLLLRNAMRARLILFIYILWWNRSYLWSDKYRLEAFLVLPFRSTEFLLSCFTSYFSIGSISNFASSNIYFYSVWT